MSDTAAAADVVRGRNVSNISIQIEGKNNRARTREGNGEYHLQSPASILSLSLDDSHEASRKIMHTLTGEAGEGDCCVTFFAVWIQFFSFVPPALPLPLFSFIDLERSLFCTVWVRSLSVDQFSE